MAIGFPTAGPIGPGTHVLISTIGPTLLDDFITISLSPTAGGPTIIDGQQPLLGAASAIVYAGWNSDLKAFSNGSTGVPDGTACTLTAWAQHHGGAIFDGPSSQAGWTLDRRSPYWSLFQYISGTPDLQAILNAVIRVFPPP